MLNETLVEQLRLGKIVLVNSKDIKDVSKVREVIYEAFGRQHDTCQGTSKYYFKFGGLDRGWLASNVDTLSRESANLHYLDIDYTLEPIESFYITETIDEC